MFKINDPRIKETNVEFVKADQAWQIEDGSSNDVVIAVLDVGVDYNHQDLKNNIWINKDEIPNNGKDDDNNGYIDDINGYDFGNGDNNPMPSGSNHGTLVAGIAGAVGGNGIGVAGVNPNATIMPLRIFGSKNGAVYAAAKAIEYAVDNGAKVINNSWGTYGYSTILYDAIKYAEEHDVLIVAGAGNDGLYSSESPFYPAMIDLPNVISVAAINKSDTLLSNSNYGEIQLGAPGVNTLSTALNNQYTYLGATSGATAHVSGAASLIWAKEPNLTAEQVKDRILLSVDKVPGLDVITEGKLNVYKAVKGLEKGSISGTVLNSQSKGVANVRLYIDSNNNNVFDLNERSTYTNKSGVYTFNDVTLGSTSVGLVNKTQQSAPTEQIYSPVNSKYSWVELAGKGSKLSILSDNYVDVNLPFAFNFYGEAYNKVKVTDNGYLTFGEDGRDYTNDAIANSINPNNFIAPFWDDLEGGSVYTMYDKSNERFIIQYDNVTTYNKNTNLTFEVILEKDGDITFQYQDVNGPADSATIGVENTHGSEGVQLAYNQHYAVDNLAVTLDYHPVPVNRNVYLTNGEVIKDLNFIVKDNFNPTPNPTPVDGRVIGEFGTIKDLTNIEKDIEFKNDYKDPVVILGDLTNYDKEMAIPIVTDYNKEGMSIKVLESSTYNGVHNKETVSYLVVERGNWLLDNGLKVNAGYASLYGPVDRSSNYFHDVGVDKTDILFSEVYRPNRFITTRQQDNKIGLQTEEAYNKEWLITHRVGYIAFEDKEVPDMVLEGGIQVNSNYTKVPFDNLTSSPAIITQVASFNESDVIATRYSNIGISSLGISLQEDKTLDSEIYHSKESLNLLVGNSSINIVGSLL